MLIVLIFLILGCVLFIVLTVVGFIVDCLALVCGVGGFGYSRFVGGVCLIMLCLVWIGCIYVDLVLVVVVG